MTSSPIPLTSMDLEIEPGMITVTEAIAAHRAALKIDASSVDQDGKPFDPDDAERTRVLEQEALDRFIASKSLSPADVQAKLNYALTAWVGGTDLDVGGLVPCSSAILGDGNSFILSDEGGPYLTFLRSLVVLKMERARP